MQKQWNGGVVAVLIVALTGLWSADAEAQERQRRARTPTAAHTAEVPVQVGVGPAGVMFGAPTYPDLGFGGRVYEDQPLHFGLRIDLTAVIEAELVRRHPGLVPRQYEQQVMSAGEVRYAPGIVSLIPSNLYLSPPINDSMALGATWSLLGIGMALTPSPVRASLSGSVIASLMYINTPSIRADHYLFARPGVELNVDVEFKVTQNFLFSVGWASQVYIPQTINETGFGMLGMGGFDEDSIWHIGQFYLQGHFRVPYSHSYRSSQQPRGTPRQERQPRQRESEPVQREPEQSRPVPQERRRPVPQAPRQ